MTAPPLPPPAPVPVAVVPNPVEGPPTGAPSIIKTDVQPGLADGTSGRALAGESPAPKTSVLETGNVDTNDKDVRKVIDEIAMQSATRGDDWGVPYDKQELVRHDLEQIAKGNFDALQSATRGDEVIDPKSGKSMDKVTHLTESAEQNVTESAASDAQQVQSTTEAQGPAAEQDVAADVVEGPEEAPDMAPEIEEETEYSSPIEDMDLNDLNAIMRGSVAELAKATDKKDILPNHALIIQLGLVREINSPLQAEFYKNNLEELLSRGLVQESLKTQVNEAITKINESLADSHPIRDFVVKKGIVTSDQIAALDIDGDHQEIISKAITEAITSKDKVRADMLVNHLTGGQIPSMDERAIQMIALQAGIPREEFESYFAKLQDALPKTDEDKKALIEQYLHKTLTSLFISIMMMQMITPMMDESSQSQQRYH